MTETIRRRRRGTVGRSWYFDETYLKVQGRWVYLYRAIDRSGVRVDVMLSERAASDQRCSSVELRRPLQFPPSAFTQHQPASATTARCTSCAAPPR
ncbi:MAG: DDE-type integrase/transposase/recombinase [Rhodopila sp.]